MHVKSFHVTKLGEVRCRESQARPCFGEGLAAESQTPYGCLSLPPLTCRSRCGMRGADVEELGLVGRPFMILGETHRYGKGRSTRRLRALPQHRENGKQSACKGNPPIPRLSYLAGRVALQRGNRVQLCERGGAAEGNAVPHSGRMGQNISTPFPYFPSFSQIQVPSYLRNPPKGENFCHLLHLVPFCPIRSPSPVRG